MTRSTKREKRFPWSTQNLTVVCPSRGRMRMLFWGWEGKEESLPLQKLHRQQGYKGTNGRKSSSGSKRSHLFTLSYQLLRTLDHILGRGPFTWLVDECFPCESVTVEAINGYLCCNVCPRGKRKTIHMWPRVDTFTHKVTCGIITVTFHSKLLPVSHGCIALGHLIHSANTSVNDQTGEKRWHYRWQNYFSSVFTRWQQVSCKQIINLKSVFSHS